MNLTSELKKRIKKDLDPDTLLPEELPIYVSSFVYMFGSLTLACFITLIITGVIMVYEGPIWYQFSQIGFFFRSMHFWAAQVFFFFMTVHFLTNFFIAGWRKGRIITWISGSLLFGISMFEAFMGYLMGGGFFAQWNQVQAKDAMNAIGASFFFNILDNGQVYGLHVVILPLVLILLLVIHLYFIRSKNVVPPIGYEQ
jgi:ubiquinol-cytochrome c reductase cytochrome b subunit